jgi:hypothetical protein
VRLSGRQAYERLGIPKEEKHAGQSFPLQPLAPHLFMLQHPRESYRTRDLPTHLAGLGLSVSSLDLRRFCRRHGIRRDIRADRPRSRPEA